MNGEKIYITRLVFFILKNPQMDCKGAEWVEFYPRKKELFVIVDDLHSSSSSFCCLVLFYLLG